LISPTRAPSISTAQIEPLYQRPETLTHERDSLPPVELIQHGELGRFFMAAAIGLRSDYEAGDLRRLAKASRDARQTRRLLALAVI